MALCALCRSGFEDDLADLLQAPIIERGAGYVVVEDRDALGLEHAVFARCGLRLAQALTLPRSDRISAIIAALDAWPNGVASLQLEVPDTEQGRALGKLARALDTPLQGLVRKRARNSGDGLHLLLTSGESGWIGALDRALPYPGPGGILRLKARADAPSRSASKLEEALALMLSPNERALYLAAGAQAVDLGAAPGGWTSVLVRHHLRVTAIDNGPLAPALLDSGLVTHLRVDGFRYRPRKPVALVVCDMVEQPRRVIELMSLWLKDGAARAALFNLKLPMKKRALAIREARAHVTATLGPRFALSIRQLYHDREEVTAWLRSA